MSSKPGGPGLSRYAPIAMIALAVVAVVGVLGWFVYRGISAPVQQTKKNIQQVQLIRPPPPPPEAPPPPPPEVKEEVKLPEPDEPDPADNDVPPPGELGLDADGVAGGDAFGLLARKGGRDLLGSSGDRFGWYGNVIKTDLLNRLAERDGIRRRRYAVVVRLWVKPDGQVERFRLDTSTGNRELDRDLTDALQSLNRVSEQPPDGMPQPVRLRIVSRG